MNSDWYKGCPHDQKKERKELVMSAKPTLEVLRNILIEKLKEEEAKSVAKDAYESPSWPYYQADHLGTVRTYKALISLLTLEE